MLSSGENGKYILQADMNIWVLWLGFQMLGIHILNLDMLMVLPIKSCKLLGAWKVIELQSVRLILL